jgi:hypothetical protein
MVVGRSLRYLLRCRQIGRVEVVVDVVGVDDVERMVNRRLGRLDRHLTPRLRLDLDND